MHAATGLVGREAELARLGQIMSEDTGRAIVVSGQAGVSELPNRCDSGGAERERERVTFGTWLAGRQLGGRPIKA